MNTFELTGVLLEKMDAMTFNKGFRKREFVIETNEDQYPQKVIFQLIQDKCDMIDSFNVGDTIRIAFNVKGREYNGKYYNALEAWRIFGEKAAAPIEDIDVFDDPDLFPNKDKQPTAIAADKNSPEGSEPVAPGSPDDDIPF